MSGAKACVADPADTGISLNAILTRTSALRLLDANFDIPPFRVISVGGKIGTGKSTLVRDAMKEGLVGSIEHINSELIADYVADPPAHAYTLQLCAMQGACVRTQIACTMAAVDKCTMVIERAAQENIMFAAANRDVEAMSAQEFRSYLRYIKKDIQKCNEILGNAKYDNILLWTYEGETMHRMIGRGDLAEQDYKDDYMEHLAHNYFRGTLESLTPEKSPAWYNLKPYIVIDWSHYGTWKSVDKLLRKNPHITAQLLLSKPIQFVLDVAGNNDKLFTWYEGETKLHMNLAWYEDQPIKTHKHQRSVFRDRFFEALSKQHTIVMHGSEACKRSLASYRHVYVDVD